MLAKFNCTKCNRRFTTDRGLKTHERQHAVENKKCDDEKYVAKRIANTQSVQQHRQMNPKLKFEELEIDTTNAIREAILFEKYLREKLGLDVVSLKDKLIEFSDLPIGNNNNNTTL